jgi:4-hydroxy-2-oxoheptanedioate aldolase
MSRFAFLGQNPLAWAAALTSAGGMVMAAGTGQAQSASPLNPLKARIQAGETVLGVFLSTASAQVAQVIARTGLDFFIVDLEHGLADLAAAQAMIAASQGTSLTPLVRVDHIDPVQTKHALDTGAFGVVFPMVRDAAEARLAVASTRYPPAGVRGIGPAFAAARWNLTVPEYLKQANDNLLTVLLIEQREALDGLDAILATPGVDVAFLAVNDLSAALGHPGQINHPEVLAAVERVETAAKKHGVALGGLGLNAERSNALIGKGYRFIAITNDVGLIQTSAASLLKDIKRK